MSLDVHAVTTWDAPAWATDRHLNEVFIDHLHEVGHVSAAEGEESMKVTIIQRDELTGEERITINRSDAEILVGGVRLTPAGARELSALLKIAADLVTA